MTHPAPLSHKFRVRRIIRRPDPFRVNIRLRNPLGVWTFYAQVLKKFLLRFSNERQKIFFFRFFYVREKFSRNRTSVALDLHHGLNFRPKNAKIGPNTPQIWRFQTQKPYKGSFFTFRNASSDLPVVHVHFCTTSIQSTSC